MFPFLKAKRGLSTDPIPCKRGKKFSPIFWQIALLRKSLYIFPMKRIRVACGILENAGKLLITKRPNQVHLGNHWEFPGGKILDQESPEEGLVRELKEELGILVNIVKDLGIIDHQYEHPTPFHVKLFFFLCHIQKGTPKPIAATQMQWVEPEHLKNYTFPPADSQLIQTLPQILQFQNNEFNS